VNRGIAAENLQDEQVERNDGIEAASAENMRRLATSAENDLGGKQPAELPLDLRGGTSEGNRHPWPPVKGCREATPLSQEAFVRASVRKARQGAELWLIIMRMPFNLTPFAAP
jgi:hypothetical protein